MKKMCEMRDLQRAVNKFETDLEKQYDICLNQGMALCTLSSRQKLSSGALGELLGLSPSNISKILRAMEQKGLVQRELGSEDKRQMYFSLTDKGRQLISSIDCEKIETPEIIQRLYEK